MGKKKKNPKKRARSEREVGSHGGGEIRGGRLKEEGVRGRGIFKLGGGDNKKDQKRSRPITIHCGGVPLSPARNQHSNNKK